MRIQIVRDFAQTKPDSEINAPFLSNEDGDPRFFFSGIFSLIKNIFEEEKKFDSHNQGIKDGVNEAILLM